MNASAFSDLLSCSICFEAFKAPLKEPLILTNCGYTICSECVKKLIETSPTRRSIACPHCRTASDVPSNGFKKNYSLADIIAKAEEPRDCGATDSRNQARLLTMPVDSTKFIGNWRFVKSENFDKYLKELGVGIMDRKKIIETHGLKPILSFEVNGEHWNMTVTSASRTVSREFDLDKEVEATTISGSKMKNTYHFVDGKLIVERKKIEPTDKNTKTEWHVEEGMLVATMETEAGVKAKQIFKRVSKKPGEAPQRCSIL